MKTKTYRFHTQLRLNKPHSINWFMSPDVIPDQIIKAQTIQEATRSFLEKISGYISVKKSTFRNKKPMMEDRGVEGVQVGYYFGVKTIPDNFNAGLWVTITQEINPFD